MSRIEEPVNIGHLQRYLEAAQEHLIAAWGALRRAGLDTNVQMFTPHNTEGRKIGSVDYHLAAVEQYVVRGLWGSYKFAGKTDGQLCPNGNCLHDLAIPGQGWYRCGHCGHAFLAKGTDSGYEDYRVDAQKEGDVLPDNVPIARDLGPSYATPQEPQPPTTVQVITLSPQSVARIRHLLEQAHYVARCADDGISYDMREIAQALTELNALVATE